MPEPEPAVAPAPDHGGRGDTTGCTVSVFWRPRDLMGCPCGDWALALAATDLATAQAWQALWAPDLDVVIWPGAARPTRRELNGGPGA